MPEGLTLAELGELGLLQRLSVHAPPGQWSDDAALLPNSEHQQWVVSTDALVQGVHFSEATTPAWSTGWRAVAANLSDLSAMGCHSCAGITVALAAPGKTSVLWVEEVYGGMNELLRHHGGTLLGGDCTRADQVMLSITAIGLVDPDCLVRRSDGQAGDVLVVSGPHGLSGLGLQLLLSNKFKAEDFSETMIQQAITAHQRPQPRFDAIAALHASKPQGLPWRIGGTDSSDGLRRSLELLGEASGYRPELDPAALPLPAGWQNNNLMQSLCLDGGEDFELVLTLDPAWAETFIQALPGAKIIGRLGESSGPPCWADSKNPLPESRGFEHFN
jgi:thiamine-monophosphate kinase